MLRVTKLTGYLTQQNLYLLGVILIMGVGVYLLTDLFERLDNFLESEASLKIILLYFAVKIPLIISQILPATFLLSTLVQLCFMARSRELIALQTGGISLLNILKFLLIYGIIWAGAQLFFSQWLGVWGEQYANEIWRRDISGKSASKHMLSNVWFLDENWVVHLESVSTESGEGHNFTGYKLSEDGLEIDQVVRASSFHARSRLWRLNDVMISVPNDFSQMRQETLGVPLSQSPKNFQVFTSSNAPSKLSLWRLGETIEQLEASGSNVEGLRAAWHSKIAYAASIIIMGVVALVIVMWKDTLYISVGAGLVFVFLFYVLFTLGGTLGEKGVFSPAVAVWIFPASIFCLALIRIFWILRPRFFH